MELCDFNLEKYIMTRLWEPTESEQRTKLEAKVIIDWKFRINQIRVIMRDITNGTVFIHSHEEIHRDLKPKNSTSDQSLFC